MNIHETRALCAWLRSVIPHQQFDDDTPEAWHPLLRDTAVEDARVCIYAILEREQYVAPRDIAQAAKRLRRDRLARAGYDELTPNADPNDAIAWTAERRALRDAIASGRMTDTDVAAYTRGDTPPLTGCAPAWQPGVQLTARDMSRGLAAAVRGVGA